MNHILFEPLLQHLARTDLGRRLATLSVQTKVEKFVLAEIQYGAASLLPEYEFWLEERRRDLTVRSRNGQARGQLREWIEAKMCYSDCVARTITRRGPVNEYCHAMRNDVKKQGAALDGDDRGAALTTALFVFHGKAGHPRHIYYPNFRHRRSLSEADIEREAIRFCSSEVPRVIARAVSEDFVVELDEATSLLCFFYTEGNSVQVSGDSPSPPLNVPSA